MKYVWLYTVRWGRKGKGILIITTSERIFNILVGTVSTVASGNGGEDGDYNCGADGSNSISYLIPVASVSLFEVEGIKGSSFGEFCPGLLVSAPGEFLPTSKEGGLDTCEPEFRGTSGSTPIGIHVRSYRTSH